MTITQLQKETLVKQGMLNWGKPFAQSDYDHVRYYVSPEEIKKYHCGEGFLFCGIYDIRERTIQENYNEMITNIGYPDISDMEEAELSCETIFEETLMFRLDGKLVKGKTRHSITDAKDFAVDGRIGTYFDGVVYIITFSDPKMLTIEWIHDYIINEYKEK